MIHHVALKEFPSDLSIPTSVKDRFWYDEENECLVFDGPMWKTTFDRLRALSQDFHYQRAVEELFRRAVPEDPPSQRSLLRPAVLAVAALVALAIGGMLWPAWSRLLAGG
jgi:hypothetical protein